MVRITDNELLQEATLVSVLENKPEQKVRRLANAFPSEPVYDLDVVSEKFKANAIKAGSIIGFNASTPIRNRGAVESLTAELTKIAHAHFYSEKDLIRYAKPRTPDEQRSTVYKQVREISNLHEGVQDMKEYMRAKMVYDGKFKYTDEKSELTVEFDLDLPEGAIVERDLYADPLVTLKAEMEAYMLRNSGAKPDYMVMNSTTLSKIKSNDRVKMQMYGNVDKMVMNADFDNLIAGLDLPQLVVDDNYITIEGVLSDKTEKLLADDKVVFHASIMGTTFEGISKENEFKTGVFVKNIETFDPPQEKTIVGEVVVPLLQNYDGLHIVNHKADEEEVVPEG